MHFFVCFFCFFGHHMILVGLFDVSTDNFTRFVVAR